MATSRYAFQKDLEESRERDHKLMDDPMPTPSRRYHRKDDNPMPQSPLSEILDTDEDWSENGRDLVPTPAKEKLVFTSPRLTVDDETLFPIDLSYQDPNKRWQNISDQAGKHRQDGSVMTIRPGMRAKAIKNGMLPYVASRVRTLNLWFEESKDNLPAWLDTISTVFFNLQHFILLQSSSISKDKETISVSARMRRLYILYRIPFLQSIDEVPVTEEERRLARPAIPEGEPVNRGNWAGKKNEELAQDSEQDEGNDAMDQSAQLQIPAAASIGNQTAMELGEELAHLTERIAGVLEEDESIRNKLGKDEKMKGGIDRSTSSLDEMAPGSLVSTSCSEDSGDGNLLTMSSSSSSTTTMSIDANRSQNQSDDLSGLSRARNRRRRNKGKSTGTDIQKITVKSVDSIDEIASTTSTKQDWSVTCGALTIGGCGPVCGPQLDFICGGDITTRSTRSIHSYKLDNKHFLGKRGKLEESMRELQRKTQDNHGIPLSIMTNELGKNASPSPLHTNASTSIDKVARKLAKSTLKANKAFESSEDKAASKTAGKGELPPMFPAASRRKVGASSLLQQPAEHIKSLGTSRRQRSFRRNARSTSMLDLEVDEEEEHEAPVYDPDFHSDKNYAGHVPGEW